MAVNVYFVRHGETYFNRFARLQGWADTPLTAKGEADAAKVGQNLAKIKIDTVYSSDLKRGIDTARILIAHHPGIKQTDPIQKRMFREVFYGSFEGHSNEEGAIWASYLGQHRFRRIGQLITTFGVEKAHDLLKQADPAHLAEDSSQLNQRADQVFAFLKTLPDGKNVVVVSHGSIIQYLACRLDQSHDYENLHNGAWMHLRVEDGDIQIISYNQK